MVPDTFGVNDDDRDVCTSVEAAGGVDSAFSLPVEPERLMMLFSRGDLSAIFRRILHPE